MSNSIYTLVNKAKYNSQSALTELNRRVKSYVDTGLKGFHGEKIVYNQTEEIDNYLSFIRHNIDKVSRSDVREVILIDSYSSATIEGAKTTVEKVRKAFSSRKKTKSEMMVINTVLGNQYAIENGVNQNNIRDLWEIITRDVCENEQIKGTLYRSGDVVVASETKTIHVPCHYVDIPQFMENLYHFRADDILLYVCILHFYFVYIHPFCDGNGRLARVWLYSDLIREFDHHVKYISISNEIMMSMNPYYATLKESEFVYSNQLNITTFMEYILQCICRAIEKGKTNALEKDETDAYILGKIGRDGIVVAKLVNQKHSESQIRKSLKKLLQAEVIYRLKEGNHYRYYKMDI